jgi:hypothetical protein
MIARADDRSDREIMEREPQEPLAADPTDGGAVTEPEDDEDSEDEEIDQSE